MSRSLTVVTELEILNPFQYQGRSAITATAALASIDAMYADEAALLAAAGGQGTLIDMGRPGGATARPQRARLTLGMTDAENEVADEELYLITPCVLRDNSQDLTTPIMVERIATIAWTAGANTVVGGRSGEVLPKSATISNTGRLDSIVNKELAKADGDPEIITVDGVGPSSKLLRVIRNNSSASASPIGSTWR